MKTIRYIFGFLFFFYSSIASAQWTQESAYPNGITDAVVAFSLGDTIYVGGGSAGSTSFYKFDPSSGMWTQKGNIGKRAFGVSFVIGSKGYTALGQSDPQGFIQASVSNDLLEYDPSTDNWTKKANFPGAPRDAAFAFVIGNKAYVGGGVDSGNNVYDDFYSYDPSLDKWDTLGPLPDYLYFNSAFVIGNYGYVATGVVAILGEVSSLWKYDPSNDSWETMSDFPGSPRESAVGFALNGKGYVGLGQSDYTSVFSDFYSYDPSSDQWTSLTPPFPGKHGEGWASAVTTATQAFVGIGTYFLGQQLLGNNDFWTFAPAAAGIAAIPVATDQLVYPNPTSDFVTLSLPPKAVPAHVIVQNSIGATCFTGQTGPDGRLDLSSVPPGIYDIEITSDDYHSNVRVVKM
jgi:N-acetylneuraminic acid mutarotase